METLKNLYFKLNRSCFYFSFNYSALYYVSGFLDNIIKGHIKHRCFNSWRNFFLYFFIFLFFHRHILFQPFGISSQQVHISIYLILNAIGTQGSYNHEIDSVTHRTSFICTVPATLFTTDLVNSP